MENKIQEHNLSFPVIFEKTNTFENEETRFTKVKCWLMHTGRNYNGSEFSKEVIEDAIPTLQYIPIVGFIEDNRLGEKDFSDHRYIITKDDGQVKRKYMGSAYGVLLSSTENNAHFELKMCDDGIEREFLVADAIMWNFLEDSKDIIDRDLIKDHSIELDENSVDGYEDEENVFHFTKFSFRAACLLGGDAQPAMEGSCVEVQFTVSDFVKDIQQELNDKYNTFAKLVNEQNEQGGIKTMPDTEFTTVMEQFNDISNIVSQFETIKDRWGDEIPRYYLVDIQDNEVIVVDRNNNYQYYGFSFTMDGDKPQIDFTNGSRKKLSYADYEEGTTAPEGAFDFGEHISKIEEVAFEKVNDAEGKVTEANEAKETAETNYSQIKAEYDEMKPKYDEYVKAEQERIDAEVDAQKDAEFAKYSDALTDCEEFEVLKEKKSEMSLKDIEGECAILYARKTLAQSNFSKSNASVATGIIDNDDDIDNDGYVSTKYGNIPVRR